MALSLLGGLLPVHAAKDVALVSGAFIRSISTSLNGFINYKAASIPFCQMLWVC